MKLNTEILDSHEAKLKVEVEADNYQAAKKKAAKQLSRKHKIPGFRPGKAPFAVVVKHLGEGVITEQAISNLIDELYPKAIEESEINPYGPGALEELETLDPPTFEFTIPLAPEVTLGDYKEFRLEYTPKEVGDEDVQKVIDNLREGQAAIENVDRPAEEGDMVYLVMSGTRKGEEDPEKKVILEERRFPVIIEPKDASQETEFPFPGFSRKLIGVSPGDKKNFQYTFKEDYEFEDLRGVTGLYKAEIEEIKGRSLPEFDDEFAKTVGNYESTDELTNEIRETLAQQFETDQKSEYESEIIDALIGDAEIKFPPQMLEDEIDDIIHGLEHDLAQQGLTVDVYLKSREFEMDDLREEVKETAEARMKRGLILMEVADKEKVEVSSEKLTERIQATLQDVAAYYSEEEAKKLGSGDNLVALQRRIATDEIISQTLQILRNIAMGVAESEETEEEKIKEDSENDGAEAVTQGTDKEQAESNSPEEDKSAEEGSEEDVQVTAEEEDKHEAA